MLRKETIRRVFVMFSSVLLLLSVVSTLYPAFASAATNDPEVDRKRRFVLAAKRCTEKTDVIDTDDDVPGGDVDGMWNDIVREGDSGHPETVIIGFDMNDNGAASCFWLMMKGVEAAQLEMKNGDNVLKADNETKAKEFLVRAYTATLPGTSFISGQSYDVVNGGNEISEYIGAALEKALNKFDHPNDDLRVARFAGGGGKPSLVATCYSFTPEANPGGYDDGRDFKVDGLGTFLLKDDFDHEAVKKLPWIKYDSAVQLDLTPRASIGDVELDFTLAYGTIGAGWDSQGSDFFPIGSDINQTDGLDNGIVDCNFVKVQKDWLFANRDKWKVDGNELTYEGTSLTESANTVIASNPPDGGASDDGQATCEASGNPLSWILCPIFNGVAELTDWIYRALIQPFLYSPPVSTDPNSESFKVWSSFRVIGNIILVIGLLVIVFGQSLGGGLIDAYTAKKVFPRIIAAAILTNLSVYLVAIAVDVSNIVGTGISQLMFAPFKASGMASFELTGVQSILGAAPLAFMAVMTGVFVSGTSVAAGGAGLMAALGPLLGGALPFILLFIILPAALILLAIFIVLALRRALIVFLVMIAPIAFALYVLPNTEKYFKKWWEFLLKALMVYPIVAALFALADIMAITMLYASNANNSNFVQNGVAVLIAFVLQLIPLAAIPFAFKMAGGILGNIYGTLAGMGKKGTEMLKGNVNDPNSLRNRTKRNMGKEVTNLRAGVQSHSDSRKRNFASRRLRRMVGGGPEIFARQAAHTEESQKRLEAISNYGNDAYIKGATISLKSLDRWSDPANSNHHRYRKDRKTGTEYYRAADGTELTRSQIEEAHKAYPTLADKTQAFKYTLSKTEALDQQSQENILSDYLNYANDTGQSYGNALGGWMGIAIPNKNASLYLRRRSISQAPSDPTEFAKGITDSSGQSILDANGNIQPITDVNGNVVQRGQIYDAGVATGSFLTDFANMAPHEMVKQTEGTFRALEKEIVKGAADPAKVQEAFDNLHRYVQGATQAAPGAPQPGGTPTAYSSSGSAAAKNAAAAQAAYENLKQRGFTPTPPPAASDRRLKKNIKQLGTTPDGIKLYEFSYLWSNKRHVGVMAQDLLESHPEAIITDALGYYRVDYTKLGLQMVSAEEFRENAHAIYLEVANTEA